jgi:hypothetical protein
MTIGKTPEGFLWTLEADEAVYVLNCLNALLRHYQTPPELWNERERQFWSAEVVQETDDSKGGQEATENLQEEKNLWRSERTELLQKWLGSEQTDPPNFTFAVLPEEIDPLVSILNERRLLLAALYAVDESKMELDLENIPDRHEREALIEIHILGSVLEVWMQLLLGDN